MSKARKESASQMILIVLIQWTSLAVIILNATALYSLKSSEKSTQGLVSQQGGLIDYILVVLGSCSFIISTFFLFYHVHLHTRIMGECHQSFSPPQALSAVEIILCVISIALWTAVVSLILTYSKDPTSLCRSQDSIDSPDRSSICKLFDTTLVLAFIVIICWALVLLATLFFLIRPPLPPTTIFAIQAPQQSSSIVTSSSSSLASQPIRSFHLNQQSNKINPTSMSERLHFDSLKDHNQNMPSKTNSLQLLMPSQGFGEDRVQGASGMRFSTGNSKIICPNPVYQPIRKSPSTQSIEIFSHNILKDVQSSQHLSGSDNQSPAVQSQKPIIRNQDLAIRSQNVDTSRHQSPATSHHQSPATSHHQSPATSHHQSPATSHHQSPATSHHQSPTSRSQNAITSNHQISPTRSQRATIFHNQSLATSQGQNPIIFRNQNPMNRSQTPITFQNLNPIVFSRRTPSVFLNQNFAISPNQNSLNSQSLESITSRSQVSTISQSMNSITSQSMSSITSQSMNSIASQSVNSITFPSQNSTTSLSQNSRMGTPESSIISYYIPPEIVPINLDTLPMIQVGALSHIDISFLAQVSQD